METKQIPPKAIEALERAITRAVQQRIDEDPDVADAYLRIGIHEKSFTVKTCICRMSISSPTMILKSKKPLRHYSQKCRSLLEKCQCQQVFVGNIPIPDISFGVRRKMIKAGDTIILLPVPPYPFQLEMYQQIFPICVKHHAPLLNN